MVRSDVNLESTESTLVALKAFFNITKKWQLEKEEQRTLLGKPDYLTFESWKRGKVTTLENDVLERVSYVLGIYKNLGILFPEESQANEWLHKKNEAFDGSTGLDFMLLGQVENLREVRYYLDAQLY